MQLVPNTPALPSPSLSPAIELQGEQESRRSMPLDAEEFGTTLSPEGGASACLPIQSPYGESHSFGQANAAIARAALISVEVRTGTVAPPAVPECSSEGNTVLGKRQTRSEDKQDSVLVADAQPREMYGSSYHTILATYCHELGYAQPEVVHQMQVGEAGLSGPLWYHNSMLVNNEYFVLRTGNGSILVAAERLSKQALKSFGIRPKRT